MITLILPIHIETEDDEAAVSAMLDSLEADSISLCQCETLVLLSGTYSRQLRGRLKKMASRFVEAVPNAVPPTAEKVREIVQNERTVAPVVVLKGKSTVDKGWLDRLMIESDIFPGTIESVAQGAASYYPKITEDRAKT